MPFIDKSKFDPAPLSSPQPRKITSPSELLANADKREKRAGKEARRKKLQRIRRHERVETFRLDKIPGYVPRVQTLRPRTQLDRDRDLRLLALNKFKYVRVSFDEADFEDPDERRMEVERRRLAKARAVRGWDPLAQARGPFCRTELWPWPHLPPHLVEDALNSYAKERALEELERDLSASKENRFRIDEFIYAAGLNKDFYKHSLNNALPALPVNVPLFALGMQRALGDVVAKR